MGGGGRGTVRSLKAEMDAMRTHKKQRFTMSERGTAAIETAILIPLYMIILFSLLFLGYLTLGQHREIQAAAFAVWAQGNQDAEVLAEKFYPYIDAEDAGGGEVGDDETRLKVIADELKEAQVSDQDFRDYINIVAIGNKYQVYTFGGTGLSTDIQTSRPDYADYLVNHGLSDGEGTLLNEQIDNQIDDAYNGSDSSRWMEAREAQLSFRFRPAYFRWVYQKEHKTQEEYLGLERTEPDEEPTLERTFEIIARVTGSNQLERLAARDPGGSSEDVLRETTEELLGVTAPSDAAEIPNIESYWLLEAASVANDVRL